MKDFISFFSMYPGLMGFDIIVFVFCFDALAGLGNDTCLFIAIEDWWKRKYKKV